MNIYIVLFLIDWILSEAVAFSAIGFKPSFSTFCSKALSSLSTELQSDDCGPLLSKVLLSKDNVTACTLGKDGSDCFDVGSIMNAGKSSEFIVPIFRIANQSTCPLCTPNNGMVDRCEPLLTALNDAIYGQPLNYSTFGLSSSEISAARLTSTDVYNSCTNTTDRSSMHVLVYQSQLLCSTSDTYGKNLSSAGNIEGILDMRAMMQCGTCAVMPCLPGQLCNSGDTVSSNSSSVLYSTTVATAAMCPLGYYCPTPSEKYACPVNHFCPLASTEPVPCRDGVAGGTCSSNASSREVVWVPLFFAVLILLGVVVLEHYISAIGIRKSKVALSKRTFHKIPIISAATVSNSNDGASAVAVSIHFNDITLVTKGTVRISGVSGIIRPGRFTAILGGSGAGKTSLMNVLLGREARTTGEISYIANNNNSVYSNSDETQVIASSLIDRIVAFVPQNDVYLRQMTVHELISHSAYWRLPSVLSAVRIQERVEEVLHQLQLQHLRDVAVGSGSDTALSPGDRKKVNIALELVSGPNVLFLDEPTTGIDASSAMNVATIIRNLAHVYGITCVAVIHQPRAEIFNLMDDMMVLTRGGKMAYQGPTQYVLSYFARYGDRYNFFAAGSSSGNSEGDKISSNNSISLNKTDFLIDITSKPPHQSIGINLEDRNTITIDGNTNNASTTTEVAAVANQSWSDLWESYGKEYLMTCMAGSAEEANKNVVRNIMHETNAVEEEGIEESLTCYCCDGGGVCINSSTVKGGNCRNSIIPQQQLQPLPSSHIAATTSSSSLSLQSLPLNVPRPGFLPQFYYSLRRGLYQHTKQGAYLSDMVIYFLGGVIMGIVTCGGALLVNAIPIIYTGSCPPGAEAKCNTWLRFDIGPATFLMTMILGAVTIPFAVRTFGNEKQVFMRESAVGAYKSSYFLGKILSDVPFMALNTFVFMAPILAIAPWRSPTDRMYGTLFCITYVVSAMGYLLSLCMKDADSAVLAGVILAILLNLFSGFVPKIGDGVIGLIMYTHWSARAITAAELWYGQEIDNNDDFNSIVPSEWKDPNITNDCGYMLLIGVLLQIVAFTVLLWNNRRVAKI